MNFIDNIFNKFSAVRMKLEGKESPSFSLFNPSESCLPTEERTQVKINYFTGYKLKKY